MLKDRRSAGLKLSPIDVSEHVHRHFAEGLSDAMPTKMPEANRGLMQVAPPPGWIGDADDASGGVVDVMVVSTELKEAKRALKESERFNRMLFAQLPIGLALCRMNGRFVEINPAFARILGRPIEEVTTLAYWDVTPCEYLECERQQLDQLERTGRYGPYEKEYVQADGTRVPVRLQGLLVERNGERLIWSSVEDISRRVEADRQRQQLESQLQQAQKMEAIGTLAGGIAHDFNNILTSVIGFGELALLRSEEGSTLHEYAGEILRAGIRAKELVQQILTFSRRGDHERQPVQVRLILREALKLLRPSLPSTIDLRQRIESDACVMADPTQLYQVLMNLCANAEHAMRKKGGVLEIGLREVEIDLAQARQHNGLGAGRHLVIGVSDTGCGIQPGIGERIFEPFFTTKPEGEGTGLGLSVVHGIVKGCGGRIDVESNPGAGTRFSIYLPVVQNSVDPSESLTVDSSPPGRGHVLLVDDEPPLLRVMSLLLEAQGYRVTAESSSQQALDIFKSDPESFDLLLTDLTMPKLDGKRLIDRVRAVRPSLPVILCSGFAHQFSEAQLAEIGIRAFLQKPILRSRMLEIVHRVLEGAVVRTVAPAWRK